jgi:hypothetical protein
MNIPVSLAQARWVWYKDRSRGMLETFLPARNTHPDKYITATVNGTQWAVWENDKLVASGDAPDAQRQAELVVCTGAGVRKDIT